MKRRQPNSNQKKIQRIYEVALAGITTALVFLLLAISMIVKYGSIGFFFFASLALVLPLYKKYYFATIFAYIAASLLCLAMPYDIMSAMGFIFYFGPISIASIIMYEKKVKWYISYPIKAIYMAGSIAFLYFVAGNIMVDFNVIKSIPFWAIELIGIVILLAMDIAQTFIYRWFAPIVGKVIRDKKSAKNTEEIDSQNETIQDTENPFEGEEKEDEKHD